MGADMLDREDSFERARRELTARLFDAYDRNREIGYGRDKVLITLSAGSLLFSMTFISALAPGKHYLGVLFFAWVWFAASIVCVIIGMRKAELAEGRLAVRISEGLAELSRRKAPDVQVTPNIEATHNRGGIFLNNCAVGAFFAGMICLGIFVGVNLWWR
jgi:hypothetical protein